MNIINYNKNFYIYCFVNILIVFQSIKFIFSEQLLNNIIRLGDEGFGYNHFSFNSNGDMIIDSEAFPVSNERRFFGLKKNGRFYFKDSNNKEIAYYSMNVENGNKGRIGGESFFIKLSSNDSNIHGRELLCGISKNYIELYDLNNKNYTLYNTTDIYGNIYTNTFSVSKSSDQSNSSYYYIFGYLSKGSNSSYLGIRKTYFSFELSNGFKHEKTINFTEISLMKSISCFFTDNNKYICLYVSKNYHLRIRVFDYLFSNESIKSNVNDSIIKDENIFFKGIHLKEEIGFFIYFIGNTSYYPYISIKQCNNKSEMVNYNFNEILVSIKSFNKNYLLNDVIKLNNYQVCYISTSSDYKLFNNIKFILI